MAGWRYRAADGSGQAGCGIAPMFVKTATMAAAQGHDSGSEAVVGRRCG